MLNFAVECDWLDANPAALQKKPGGERSRDRAKKMAALLSRQVGFHFTGHDLRRTATIGMAEIGIPVHVIALVLNHVDGTPPQSDKGLRSTFIRC